MKLRDAQPSDGDAIRSVVRDTLAEFGFDLETNGVDADLEDIAAAYQHDGGVFRVLVDDTETIVGCGGLYPMSSHTAELRKMYFRPTVRGHGHGRALLEELVTAGRAHGFHRIVLETASNLTDAIRLYQKFGFVETDGDKHSCRCDRTFALALR